MDGKLAGKARRVCGVERKFQVIREPGESQELVRVIEHT